MDSDGMDIRPNHIALALDDIAMMLARKSNDYANGSADPFVNFKETAAIIGFSPTSVVLTQCGIKMSRIRHLEEGNGDPVNESLMDSYLDLACYAALAYAMEREKRA